MRERNDFLYLGVGAVNWCSEERARKFLGYNFSLSFSFSFSLCSFPTQISHILSLSTNSYVFNNPHAHELTHTHSLLPTPHSLTHKDKHTETPSPIAFFLSPHFHYRIFFTSLPSLSIKMSFGIKDDLSLARSLLL